MPPRSGQLDEISEAIGELKGSVKSIESYVHEGRHGINNLSQKVDGLGVQITREIAAVEARIEAKFEGLNNRVSALEETVAKDQGAKSAFAWLIQSPLVGWLAGAAFAAWLFLTGKVQQ